MKVTGWGFLLPGGKRLVVQTPATTWEPRLPHWVPSADRASWFMEARDVRSVATAQRIAFQKMVPFVQLADGREICAPKGVPLA